MIWLEVQLSECRHSAHYTVEYPCVFYINPCWTRTKQNVVLMPSGTCVYVILGGMVQKNQSLLKVFEVGTQALKSQYTVVSLASCHVEML